MMEGQLYTISKINLIHGILNYLDQHYQATITELHANQTTTVKSGEALHIQHVKRLCQFAEALGLVDIINESLSLTTMGTNYLKAGVDKWIVSDKQAHISHPQ